MTHPFLTKIRKTLRSHRNASAAERDKRYHKYEYNSLGLGAVQFHAIMKTLRSEIDLLSLEDAKLIASELASTKVEEETQAANFVLGRHLKKMATSDLRYLSEYAEALCSWSQVDAFASMVMQPLIVKYPAEIIRILRKWNKATSVWLRRLSVVVFTRKTTSTSEFTSVGLELCENLVDAEEDLLRKGVGWALKDLMRGDKQRVLDYVKDLRLRGVSSTITLYAIADLKGKEREEILKIGKK